LAFREPFPYHPHITLAQGLTPERVQSLYEVARKRWAAFPHSRRIRAERACFVQSTIECTWVDLAEIRLAGVTVGEVQISASGPAPSLLLEQPDLLLGDFLPAPACERAAYHAQDMELAQGCTRAEDFLIVGV